MATMMKQPIGNNSTPGSEQLRRDRITAIIVPLIVVALMGLVIYLASLGNGGAPMEFESWPMIP